MVIEDFNFNYKMFIEDDIFEGDTKFALNKLNDTEYKIIRDDDIFFSVNIVNDKNFILTATAIKFDDKFNNIMISGLHGVIAVKSIGHNDIINISKTNNNLNIEITEVPEFINYDNDGTYPKFDIHISDCLYKVKIYVSESEMIDIPYYKSHQTIASTLDHIYSMVHYFTNGHPTFMSDLCNHNIMNLTIAVRDLIDSAIVKYELGEDSIVLIDNEETKYVPYHTFFKLVMDSKWDVTFIDTLPE